MIDIEAFVKKNYPKIIDLGLAVRTEEADAIDLMKRYPQDMLNDLGEEGLIAFLFFVVGFSDVFATDFEGIEYVDFLNLCQNISGGELIFEDVTIDIAEENFEKGEGTIEVSFRCNESEYNYSAKMYYDWFDTEFISYLNKVFERMGIEKRLIMFGDPNGAWITYQKPDFCQRIKEAFPTFDASVA